MGAQWCSMVELESMVGKVAAETLIERFRGKDLHVRKNPAPDIIALIGEQAAKELSRYRGGSSIRLPMNSTPKKVVIIEMLEAGRRMDDIATECQCGKSYVEMVSREMRGEKTVRSKKPIDVRFSLPACLMDAFCRD